MRSGPFLLLLAVLGCATAGESGTRRRTSLITHEEIQGLQVPTAFDVIEILRPQFLRTRGDASINNPAPVPAVVYVDGLRFGDSPESLKTLIRTMVQEIEYLDSREATTRYGTGHRGGAILVKTR